VLQFVAACCSVLQRVALCCSVLQSVAVCFSVLLLLLLPVQLQVESKTAPGVALSRVLSLAVLEKKLLPSSILSLAGVFFSHEFEVSNFTNEFVKSAQCSIELGRSVFLAALLGSSWVLEK